MKWDNEHNEQRSAIATSVVAGLFLALCFLVSCWDAPGPPWPESETGMTLSLGSIEGTTETGSPQPENSSPQESQESINEIQGTDIESEVEVPDSENTSQSTNDATAQDNPSETPPTDQPPTDTPPNDNPPSDNPPRDNPPLFNNPGDAAGDPTGNPDHGKPDGNTPVYTPGENQGTGTGTGGGGEGLVMDSWGWRDKPDTRAVKHTGTIKVKIVVDDEGNITNITFVGDYSAFDVDDREAIKAAIRRSGVKAKNLSSIPPASEEGIATFIIKR